MSGTRGIANDCRATVAERYGGGVPVAFLEDLFLYYERAGSGKPVVFIHGGFASLRSCLLPDGFLAWDWERELARSVDLVTYDRRGCYRSSCPLDGYGLVEQAGDLARLLDHLGLQAAHVLASSAGGPIALAFGATFPGRTKSLMLVGTGVDLWRPLPDDPVRPVLVELLDRLDADGVEASFERRPVGTEGSFDELYMAQEWAERGELETRSAEEEQLRAAARVVPRPVRLAYHVAELRSYQAYLDNDARGLAAAIKAPTLVVHGERDRAVPLAWAEELAGLVAEAQLVTLADCSHAPHATAAPRER